MPVRLIAVAVIAALPIALHAQHAAPKSEQLGVVSFANSGAPRAQKQFLRGIALLHSFMYGEAADAFQQAHRADSAFAMAYWLEAATYVHSAWRQENLAAANAALERLAPTREARLARAGTPRERQYGAAIEALVAKGVPEQQRIRAWSDTMHAIAAAYPHDLDARAFAALGAMNLNYLYPAADSAQRDRDHAAAEALAMSVYKESPKHPGGVHYVIHINDDPIYAARGLEAARAYAKVAPDADHALHMPSHIFVQLGLWDDATHSNERAWPASRAAPMSHGDEGPSASWHTLQWLQYSYLQQGRRRAARALIDSARTILRGAPSNYWDDADARFVLSDMLFRYASETEEGWADVAPEVKAEGTDTRTPRGASFTSIAAFHAAAAGAITGDSSAAHAYIKRIRARIDSGGIPPMQRIRGELLASQLEALIALSRADTTAALAAWQRASVADEGISPLGPPALLPSHERLGELLLRRGQSSAAASAYQKALELRPNRAAALLGLARAQRAAGDMAGSERTYKKLALQWHSADPSVAGAAEVRRAGTLNRE
jgi:tetratricopeptide (TPR) repeat protein